MKCGGSGNCKPAFWSLNLALVVSRAPQALPNDMPVTGPAPNPIKREKKRRERRGETRHDLSTRLAISMVFWSARAIGVASKGVVSHLRAPSFRLSSVHMHVPTHFVPTYFLDASRITSQTCSVLLFSLCLSRSLCIMIYYECRCLR